MIKLFTTRLAPGRSAGRTATGADTTRSASLGPRHLLWAAAVLAVAALALVNLEAYPATWFDEGQYMHVPKALLQHGVYADWSADGPRYYGPTTAAGPTVLLPIAGAFALFGSGLLQARLVMAGYLLACVALTYLLSARIYTRAVALLATALLISSRSAATLEWGRQVLGEVPVLVFVLAGLLCWVAALQRRSIGFAVASGLLWGLALVTKNQAIVAFAPAIVILSLLEWRWFRNGHWTLWLVPPLLAGAIGGAWLLILFTFLGPGQLAENLELTRKAAGGAIFVLTPEAIARSLRTLVSPKLYGGLLLPALAYGVYRLRRRRDRAAEAEAAVLVVVVVWLAWYICSLGWPRYAYVGAALGALPVAGMLIDAWNWGRRRRPRSSGLVFGAVVVLLVALPLAQTARSIALPDRSVLSFSEYLAREIPEDTRIATWEPELGGLTDHRFDYPAQALLDVAVRHEWSGEPPARLDLSVDPPPYVVVGPFGTWTGVYPAEQINTLYREVHRDGPYILYRRLT